MADLVAFTAALNHANLSEAERSKDIRCMMEPSIILKYRGIVASKSFGKRSCFLCNEERAQIVKAKNGPKRKRLLNHDLRFGVGCSHISKFHTFCWECT